MICIGMRSQNVIDVIQAAPPEIFRNYRLSNTACFIIKLLIAHRFLAGCSGLKGPRSASSIDQKSGVIRESHKRRVALANIKKVHPEFSFQPTRTPRMKDDHSDCE